MGDGSWPKPESEEEVARREALAKEGYLFPRPVNFKSKKFNEYMIQLCILCGQENTDYNGLSLLEGKIMPIKTVPVLNWNNPDCQILAFRDAKRCVGGVCPGGCKVQLTDDQKESRTTSFRAKMYEKLMAEGMVERAAKYAPKT